MSGDAMPMLKRVVGIQFTDESLVPVVMLKAHGEQAEKLVADAISANQKPVINSAQLANQLYRIPMDHAVSPDLFPLMAALLAHVIQVDKSLQEKLQGAS